MERRRCSLEGGLGEAVPVRDVVHGVDDIERVRARGVHVRRRRRRRGEAGWVIEHLVRCRLRSRGSRRGLVDHRVVAPAQIFSMRVCIGRRR